MKKSAVNIDIRNKLSAWAGEARYPFFAITLIPVLLGAVAAKAHGADFSNGYFWLTIFGALFLHMGARAMNGYLGYNNGRNVSGKEYLQAFSLSHRLGQNGSLTQREILFVAVILMSLGIFAAILLALKAGNAVLIIAAAALLYAVMHAVFRNSFYAGEIITGFCFGTLATAGSYYVQAETFTSEILYLSLPVSLLVFLVLWINEFPEYTANRVLGKKPLMVRLGRKKAMQVYVLVLCTVYGAILLLSWRMNLPALLLSVATIPLAIKSVSCLSHRYDDPAGTGTAPRLTVSLYTDIGLIFVFAYYIRLQPNLLCRMAAASVVALVTAASFRLLRENAGSPNPGRQGQRPVLKS